jgi:hypothetical protein
MHIVYVRDSNTLDYLPSGPAGFVFATGSAKVDVSSLSDSSCSSSEDPCITSSSLLRVSGKTKMHTHNTLPGKYVDSDAWCSYLF